MITIYTIFIIIAVGADSLDDLNFDYEETTISRTTDEELKKKLEKQNQIIDDYEPIITLKSNEKLTKISKKEVKDFRCADFAKYATNCTMSAAALYKSPRVTPPLPYKLQDWCKSIRYLTNCAIEWNTECNESSDNLFNEDSIKGHMHVLDYVCDDEWFLARYRDMVLCIEATSDQWEECYTTFKMIVEEQKNITRDWTHFETHFYLCCAQAQFRRCILDFVFKIPKKCTYEQAVTLQKFSVIISEGDVYQECDGNILYANCPNGDPTPNQNELRMLMDGGETETKSKADTNSRNIPALLYTLNILALLYVCPPFLVKFYL